MTPLQQLKAEACWSIREDRPINHRIARQLAEVSAPRLDQSSDQVTDFILRGSVPESLNEVVQLHHELAFGRLDDSLSQALARYLRERFDRRTTGEFWGWDLLTH
jgi:hypothetical protein